MSTWSFRGTALDSLGIVTLVSDSMMMPNRRAENVLIPFQDGRIFVEKQFEQRSMTLGLEIIENSLVNLESKMDTVKALLGRRTLGTLAQTMDDLSVRTIEAEYAGDLNLKRISPQGVRLLLEFIAPDPFFRSSTLFSDTHVIDASPKAYTLTNPGTVDERNPKIVLTGPLSNVTITNITNGVSLTYTGTIASPRVVTIQKIGSDYAAADDLGANVIGNVIHSGSAALFVLEQGANSLSVVDATHTTGSVKIEFYPPYL
jgi:phage-related protein